MNINKHGYVVIDDFLKDELYNELYDLTETLSYEYSSKETWPEGLYKNTQQKVETGNVLISKEWFSNYLPSYRFAIHPKSNNTTKTPKPIIKFQDELLSFMTNDLNIDIDGNPDGWVGDTTTRRHRARFQPGYRNGFSFWSRLYKWKPESSILWHNDDIWNYGISYYLNKEWKSDWGGELLLKDGMWIKPKTNRVIIIKTPLEHKTCLITPGAPDRMTIQSFIKL